MVNTPSKTEKLNTLNSNVEIQNFKTQVHNSIVNSVENLNGFVDDLIIVFDNNSWRKSVKPHRPYYIDELDTTPLRYKENRDGDKEKSLINYDNFYKAKNEIVQELLEEKVKVLCLNGAEGDDLIMYLTSKNTTNPILIQCSDGDLKYVVSDNVMLFRLIKSKISPSGEFVISPNLMKELYDKQDIMTLFLQQNTTKSDTLKRLFQCDIQDKKNFIQREPNISIIQTEKYIGLFLKCVCGDKKDNIFPVFRWLNKTGTMWNKVTELMIQKAFVKVFVDEIYSNESIERLFFKDENKDKNLFDLLSKIKETQKLTIDIEKVIPHYQHNLKMNMLEIDNLPQDLIERIKVGLSEISKFPKYSSNPKQLRTKVDNFKQKTIDNII